MDNLVALYVGFLAQSNAHEVSYMSAFLYFIMAFSVPASLLLLRRKKHSHKVNRLIWLGGLGVLTAHSFSCANMWISYSALQAQFDWVNHLMLKPWGGEAIILLKITLSQIVFTAIVAMIWSYIGKTLDFLPNLRHPSLSSSPRQNDSGQNAIMRIAA
jgi:hypothetical protein